jgi:hypothetical protein
MLQHKLEKLQFIVNLNYGWIFLNLKSLFEKNWHNINFITFSWKKHYAKDNYQKFKNIKKENYFLLNPLKNNDVLDL